MELTVLGCDGMYPAPGGATSGYLVRHDGFALWVDLGSGTFASLQEHLPFDEVDALLVTHRHPDHVVDLFGLFIARLYGGEEPAPEIPLFGLPDVLERVQSFVAEGGEAGLERSFRLTEIGAGGAVEAGPFRISTAPMAHVVPTVGVRLEADGTSLAYSGDTGPTPELVRLAEGADLLIAEASWQDDGLDYPPDLHLRASEAAAHARDAEVPRLMLTHFKPGLDRRRSVDEAAGLFGGEILAAERGMTLEVAG